MVDSSIKRLQQRHLLTACLCAILDSRDKERAMFKRGLEVVVEKDASLWRRAAAGGGTATGRHLLHSTRLLASNYRCSSLDLYK